MAADDFSYQETSLNGLKVVTRKRRTDLRGHFSRVYSVDDFSGIGFSGSVAQINLSFTGLSGSARGLHYQIGSQAEIKFVSVLRGRIYDVAVDIRHGSPTFLRWHAELLSADNLRSLLIPRGFAHGFQTLTDNCELLYLHSAQYAPEYERVLQMEDPRLAIEWPIPFAHRSARDIEAPLLAADFIGIGP